MYQPDPGSVPVLTLKDVSRSFSVSTVLWRVPPCPAGATVIRQERTLLPGLSVSENVFIGRQPRGALRRIDHPAVHERAAALRGPLGAVLDPERLARVLSIAAQPIVEIAEALSVDARIQIMAEPTAALTADKTAWRFSTIKALRAKAPPSRSSPTE
ncbi:hypothetical protein ACWGDT_05790 [Streptomyces avermitilis]